MLDSLKFNTVPGDFFTVIPNCKLLFANKSYIILSTELLCDEILASGVWRVAFAERIELFDTRLLARLEFADPSSPVCAAMVVGAACGGYRFVSSGRYSPSEFAAVAFSLFSRGAFRRGECVRLFSPTADFTVSVTDDGVVLFK